MTDQLSFFAPTDMIVRPTADDAATTSRAVESEKRPENKPQSDKLTNCAILQSDVLRIVQHKAGPLRQLLNGQPSGREFRFIETHEGSWLYEFTDNGERVPAPWPEFVTMGLAAGDFVEVAL